MKGGNGATNGSGITQFAEGEPKRRNYDNNGFANEWKAVTEFAKRT
ncbi:MAG: hypothetical protein IKS45_02170 [Thermoguttaceae bacterium]|nr:hypothetical protein [Thermoguttaceae bacterium]